MLAAFGGTDPYNNVDGENGVDLSDVLPVLNEFGTPCWWPA